MEEIINNIMQTPGNTNPNVLRGQLQGIMGAGILVVHDNDGVLDKTWSEICDAPLAIITSGFQGMMTTTQYVAFCVRGFSGYEINAITYGSNGIVSVKYIAQKKDAYPTLADPDTSSAPSINV